MTNLNAAPTLSLDGALFTLTQTSGRSYSLIRFHQHNAMVWGEYLGDASSPGRFVGRLTGDLLEMQFVHAESESGQSGQLTYGRATALIDSSGKTVQLVSQSPGAEDSTVTTVWAQSMATEETAEAFDTAFGLASARHSGDNMIDDTEFVLLSSTASEVNHESPSRFFFHEAAGIVWAEYEGDTVTFGYTVGFRVGNMLQEWFVHEVKATGATLIGDSASQIEMRADGQLELKEDFVLDGVPGYSICVEV
ncbi:hypothetical protein [Leifsonia sp. A12D58]|uniref:hypothetical protein n=1 Tax=Leifsonia sp. A12D58 TaxID=3397674 RepID=UPI0039E1247B